MYLQPGNSPATPAAKPQAHAADDDSDEEEPDIGMGSFMSGDPNFNRETSDSQSMTKALGTLKTYLSNYAGMKQFRPAMLVFLHSLLARKEAKWYKALNFVFFDWLADDWKSAGLEPKPSKRAAFAVYSTFLNREGPLSLEGVARSLDPSLGLGRPALAESIKTLSQLFAKRPMDSYLERIVAGFGDAQASLQASLEALTTSVSSEIQTKRRDGFVSDILPGVDGLRPDLSDERQQRFIEQCRGVMLAHVNFLASTPFGGPLEAGCLASLLERLFRLRLRADLSPELPQFNVPRPRSGWAASLKTREKRGMHLLKPVELDRIRACSACGKLLCGPGPQAMRCSVGNCQVFSHRACIDQVKPIGCSTLTGFITGRDNKEEPGSAHADKPSSITKSQPGGQVAPKTPAVTPSTVPIVPGVVQPISATGPLLPASSMQQLNSDALGGGGSHRGSVDSGRDPNSLMDPRLLSPNDLIVEAVS